MEVVKFGSFGLNCCGEYKETLLGVDSEQTQLFLFVRIRYAMRGLLTISVNPVHNCSAESRLLSFQTQMIDAFEQSGIVILPLKTSINLYHLLT